MFVSAEIVTMIATGATLLVAMLGGFGWLITRMDARFAQVDARFADFATTMDARFAQVDARFTESASTMDARFDRIERELTEVKVAVARLEGPLPRLLTGR